MRIAILGANGFIGTSLAKRLAQDSVNELTLFSRTISSKLKALADHKHVKIIQGDYNNDLELLAVLKNQEIVFHLISSSIPSTSWAQPELEVEFNLLPTIKLFQLCVDSGVRKVVFASSGGTVYGESNDGPVDENHRLAPFSPYGITKVASENYLFYFNKKNRLNYDVYRMSNVFGAGSVKRGFGVITTWLRTVMNDEPIQLFGDGDSFKDYIYIDDAIALMLNSLQDLESTEVYNICSGTCSSLNEIIECIRDITGKKIETIKSKALLSDNRIVSLSNKKIRSKMPKVKIRSLREGIKEAWMVMQL